MKLRSGVTLWQAIDPACVEAPPLAGEASCEVAVVGAGITGALIAYHLVRAGVDTVVVDKRPLGTGSTLASTGLLQYEIDTPLVDLIGKVGEAHALHAYRRGRRAIDEIESLVEELVDDCAFTRRESLYFASSERDLADLDREFECRRAAGFDVELLSRAALAERSTIAAPGAILSRGDAQIDPVRFTRRLLVRACEFGLRAFAHTDVCAIDETASGLMLHAAGATLRADRVVFATGYESHCYLRQDVGALHRTYAVASAPLSTFDGWPNGCLIWETARPYFYARQTNDGRVVIGGEDTPYFDDHRRDCVVEEKTARLQRRFEELFPKIAFEPEYLWAGTFAETKDGLPYLGQPRDLPAAYFALGYGGNGITFSMIAASLIRDLYFGRENEDAVVFRFDR